MIPNNKDPFSNLSIGFNGEESRMGYEYMSPPQTQFKERLSDMAVRNRQLCTQFKGKISKLVTSDVISNLIDHIHDLTDSPINAHIKFLPIKFDVSSQMRNVTLSYLDEVIYYNSNKTLALVPIPIPLIDKLNDRNYEVDESYRLILWGFDESNPPERISWDTNEEFANLLETYILTTTLIRLKWKIANLKEEPTLDTYISK